MDAGQHVQLGLDDLAVRFDGLGANVQFFGDLDGGHSLADQLEYLQLAIGERFRRVAVQGFADGSALQELGGHLRTEVHFAAEDLPDGRDDLGQGLVFIG